ncbi:filamentous hemagglutinin, partial [Listeria seeligeri]|nr:filamentous hemagglutinin [Listeria seeligeri]
GGKGFKFVTESVEDINKINKKADKVKEVEKSTEKASGTNTTSKDFSQFEKLKGEYASKEIPNADRIGSGLKDDPSHRAASFITEDQLAKGRVTSFTGSDNKSYSMLQTKGEFNGLDGIYEYILDSTGKITHQRFIEGGKITGFPNQKVPKGGY